jgi:hypothetical protein
MTGSVDSTSTTRTINAHRAVSIESDASRELARGVRAGAWTGGAMRSQPLTDRHTVADPWSDLYEACSTSWD